ESDGLPFEPDVVLLAITVNDMADVPMVAEGRWPKATAGLELCAFAQYVVQRWHAAEAPPVDWGRALAEHPRHWYLTQQAVRKLRRLLDPRGVRLVVTLFPMLTGLDRDYPYRPLHEAAEDFMCSDGVEFIDLKDAVLGRHDADLWVDPADQHPNPVAHRLFADALIAALGPSLVESPAGTTQPATR